MSRKNELHSERPATFDDQGHRVYLYPEDVKGVWRNRRNLFFFVLIFFYMVLPWLHWHGQQIILIDLPKREFHLFSLTLYGSDAPLLFFVFLGLAAFIAFITSVFGRVWCGHACPQTVFIDAFYSRIERWVEGRSRARKIRDQGPWNFSKIWRKTLKWFLFILISLHITHSFLGYFVGTYELFHISFHSPREHWPLFITMLTLTVIILFDFGWFREQFCVIACPYGRLQSVLLDSNSWGVSYDNKRGEPRRSPEIPKEKEGDCINCYHCVKVCPTGIDIRRGLQLECIQCTQCIDACDEIMVKIGKPKGLIGYSTENLLRELPTKYFGPRNLIYAFVCILVFILLFINIGLSQHHRYQFIRSTRGDFETIDENRVLNHFKFIIEAHHNDEVIVKLHPPITDVELVLSRSPIPIKLGRNNQQVFFKFPKSILLNGKKIVTVQIQGKSDHEVQILEVPLVGPLK